MKMMVNGFAGWARFEQSERASVKMVDMGITVVGTVFLAVTYMLIHG